MDSSATEMCSYVLSHWDLGVIYYVATNDQFSDQNNYHHLPSWPSKKQLNKTSHIYLKQAKISIPCLPGLGGMYI